MFQTHLLSEALGQKLKAAGKVLATAESCTGGGVSAAITEIAGSSEWFDRAFVTYSNSAKMEMLGVNVDTLESHGAVSEPVVKEMVLGALANSQASIAVSISGIAGPGGGVKKSQSGRFASAGQTVTDGSKSQPITCQVIEVRCASRRLKRH